jgi:hypothetical protein
MVDSPANVVVTTTRQPTAINNRRARRYAAALDTLFLPRENRSFVKLLQLAHQQTGQNYIGVLVVSDNSVSIQTASGKLIYHPCMALHRVASLRHGKEDTMVQAMQLQPGDHVLDCTAGLAADAVVAAHAVGPQGRVLALESSGPLALLLKLGLKSYPAPGPTLTAAMRRVRVSHSHYQDFLNNCADKSYDIVYFDPMFTQPIEGSSGIAPLRPLADHTELTKDVIKTAMRVARRYVVVKDRHNGPYVTNWQWDYIRGGRNSRLCYCLLQP